LFAIRRKADYLTDQPLSLKAAVKLIFAIIALAFALAGFTMVAAGGWAVAPVLLPLAESPLLLPLSLLLVVLVIVALALQRRRSSYRQDE
jgi:uncharacterized membrane protein